jgi:hypothetical protein
MIILPDSEVNTVKLAISLLDTGGGSDVKIVCDMAIVTPVLTLFKIPFTITDESIIDGFLDIKDGRFNVSTEVN